MEKCFTSRASTPKVCSYRNQIASNDVKIIQHNLMMYKNMIVKYCNDLVHTYKCDIEILLQFEDTEVGSRREGRTTVCDADVGRTIHCKPNTRAGALNPYSLK